MRFSVLILKVQGRVVVVGCYQHRNIRLKSQKTPVANIIYTLPPSTTYYYYCTALSIQSAFAHAQERAHLLRRVALLFEHFFGRSLSRLNCTMAFPTNEVSATTNDVINNVETVLNESSANEICEVLKTHEDRYDGVIVDIENMQNDAARFAASLKASLSQWACQGKKAVWIKVPKEQAKLVPVAIEEGFGYHHAEPSYVMLVYWIPRTVSTIPDNASHQVGVAAFVFNDKEEVLVVQENCGPYKNSGLWKMPTGRINQGEGVKEGAIREVQEETGIDAEFIQVIGFRDGHNAPFGKSDLLFVCMLKSVSSNIVVQDTEISAAKWMAMEEFASQPKNQQSKLLKDMISVCVASINGRCQGFSGIGISSNSRKPSAFYCTAIDTQ